MRRDLFAQQLASAQVGDDMRARVRRRGALLRAFTHDCADAAGLRRKHQEKRADDIMEKSRSTVLHTLIKKHGFARVCRHAIRVRDVLARVERAESRDLFSSEAHG